MGYISTERVAEIRSELKATFPDFTFRCYREHNSTVNVVIVSAPIQFLSHEQQAKGYVQANHYGGFKSQFSHSPEAIEALDKIQAIITKGQTHYETGDYGTQPSFYEHIYIGEYNKPFVQCKPRTPGNNSIGVLQAGDMAKIVHNQSKDGIEIYFPSKPNAAVLDAIKAQGFRWGKFNKCWYARISSRTIAAAEKYGSLPSSLTNDEQDNSFDNMIIDQQAEAIGA